MVEDVGAFHVRETGLFGQLARARQQLERRTELSVVHAGPGLDQERAKLELLRLRRELQTVEGFQRLVELLSLDRGLGAHHRGLDLCVLVPALPGLEVRDVDTKSLRDPGERLLRRARLAPLDLAHVLLREAIAGQLRLRQPCGNAKLA